MGTEPGRTSAWERFTWRRNRRRRSRELDKLRRDGTLERILEESPYTFVEPGQTTGDEAYLVYPKDDDRLQATVFASIDFDEALWWIVNRNR